MQSSFDAAPSAAVRALMLASRAFVAFTARSLAVVEGDVTLPQFRALVVLAVRGPQRSIDIAEELQVNPSTGTRMLDRLIRKGLVRRMRSTSDRRVVWVRLTPTGRDVVEQVLTRRRAELERLVAATADLWQPAVTDALTAFAQAAGEISEQDWWLGWTAHRDEAQDEHDHTGAAASSFSSS
jgi:DNA-binding MarR family transcriptional regulator